MGSTPVILRDSSEPIASQLNRQVFPYPWALEPGNTGCVPVDLASGTEKGAANDGGRLSGGEIVKGGE